MPLSIVSFVTPYHIISSHHTTHNRSASYSLLIFSPQYVCGSSNNRRFVNAYSGERKDTNICLKSCDVAPHSSQGPRARLGLQMTEKRETGNRGNGYDIILHGRITPALVIITYSFLRHRRGHPWRFFRKVRD